MRLNIYAGWSLTFTVMLCWLSSTATYGQLTGTKYIPGDYSTVSAAVIALNASGPGAGGVVFNIAAGHTETIATAAISLTATGTAGNPITFQRDPATSGANPEITAYTGGTYTPATPIQDGIFCLRGSDYVTIDGIDLKENAANTTNPSTMEYGYALYKASTSNGCQNVTIRNCVVTLNSINNALGTAPMVDGSTGIIVMNALATTATTPMVPISGGTNSNNKFYGNTIQNCNTGLALIGYAASSPFTLADANNDVGGSSLATGNTIINFGGAAGALYPAAAIRTQNQYTLNVAYNTINSNNGSGANHPNTLRGIYINTATSATATIANNTVSLAGSGTTQNVVGIENASGTTAAANTITIGNNTITNCSYATATTGGFYGISNSGSPASLVISNNTLSGNSGTATTTGFFYGILNTGAATSVLIRANMLSNNTTALTTGLFGGIVNTGAAPSLSIRSNTFSGNTVTTITGVHYLIYNTGVVTTTLNIDSNEIGTVIGSAITFTAANSAAQIFINNTAGTNAAALSISNNTFRNVTYSVAGTGANTYILNAGITRSQAINNNVFAGLNVNTAGSITFISNSVAVPVSGTQDVSNNTISSAFAKAAGGTLTLFTNAASSAGGSIINQSNNNFSNITVTGATIIAGWVNTDAGSPTKSIRNNTFSNWTGGTGAITALNVNIIGTANATSGNLISNITSAGAITGIATSSGNDNIFANTINTLTSTGAVSVIGIAVTGGTAQNVYGNKIYDLQASIVGGTVYGISVSGTTSAVVTANISNNLIGNLRTPAANVADAVRGISVTSTRVNSTINVYYNTIYLNAGSTGALFGTSGIYHTVSATSTTAALNLRNNIVANFSTPNGAGFTVAYRLSGVSLANYASTSGNNLFYAGAPAANRLVFYNGTNADQTIASYKTRVAPMDALSVTEDLSTNFLSTSGASASFLHLDAVIATQAESGAANITGFTTDYDSVTRQGNIGYSGTGTSPDMGADEFDGIKALPLSGTYTVGTGGNYTSLTRTGGLFADINSLGLSGDVDVQIISDLTEDGINALNEWVELGVGNYVLSIQPNSATTRMISGNVAGPLIKLNGADRLTIDGRYGGSGKYLTFRNTNTLGTTGTAFTFIDRASNNTLQYCNIEAYANATNGVILFSTSALTGGNSNNLISNCDINATVGVNTGILCIYSAGTNTAGFQNSGNTISNNNIFDYRDRGIDITATGSTAWTISGNSLYNGSVSGAISYAASSTLHGIRVLGGSGYSILNNYIGGSANQAGGSIATYASSAGLLTYQGLLLTTISALPASNIKGNTIANISIAAAPTSVSSSGTNVFLGIETNGSGINIGGSLAGEGNNIGSNTGNGSILITTTTTLATHRSNLRGINCASTGGLIIGNRIGGIDIRNTGATAGPSTFLGIYVSHVTPPSQINNNVVGSSGVGAATNSIRVLSNSSSVAAAITGISIAAAVTGTVQIDGNVIQNISHLSPVTIVTAGGITGISSAAIGTAAIAITNNTIAANYITAYTTGLFYGISNSGTATSLTINNNTIAGSSSGSATGIHYSIVNTGVVTGAITINNNHIGTATSPAFTFNVASSGAEIFILNSGGTINAALSISNNDFQGVNYPVASTGTNTYISNTAATLSQAINGNTFTNLNVNTSGNVTFITNSVIVSGTGTQNVNNNSISGTFTKRAGGTLTLFTSTAASLAGSIINNNGNNFSNITVTGATTVAGWINTDAGASTKTIQNNTFGNWSGGTSAVTVLSVNLTGTSNAITDNLINSIAGGGVITGIATAAGNGNIYSNTINTLSTTGLAAVTGISVTAGATKNIYRNKIYDLQAGGATGSVNGILVSGSTVVTVNIYNNLIGDLRVPAGNSATDLIRGISITSTTANSAANVSFNTIYLNASSTGAAFSSSGIYHSASATATTATLTLRNNSITNTSTPSGAGLTVAFKRSSNALGNYAAASNNNLFYAGTPGAGRLVYNDVTNSEQLLANYKTRVLPRDSVSVTELLTAKFLSTTGSSSVFLHMNSTIPSMVESGAANITGITDDFDGQTRQGNPGYSGAGYAPDIGADEVFGIEAIPPAITYTLLAHTTVTTNRAVSGVIITDASGVNNTGGTKPRIYYKRFRDANTYLDNTASTNSWKYTEATNSSSPYTFTIDYSLLYGASVTAGEVQYFIVAQDLATITNIGINSGTFNATSASVALSAAAFPITGTINSYDIPYSGIYNIGSGEVLMSLTKIDGLFGSINRVGLSGNTTINITSDISEDGYYALNQWIETGVGNYKLTIQPDAATTRIISGDVAGGLIRLDGADKVTIDGSNGGSGQYLTFRNTNAAGASGTAFTFINGATTNTVKYCNAEAYSNATHGVILFGSSSVAGGNSSNVIDNCDVVATVAGNSGSTGIYSSGTLTAGFENSSNTISNCNIYNYRDRGLDITSTGSTGWTVSGNSFYNGGISGAIDYTASSVLHGIRIAGGSGYSVLNNYIGGNASLASGTNATYSSTTGSVSYQGILLTTSSATPASDIKGNRISRISIASIPTAAGSACFTGIETNNAGISIGGTSAGEGNTIGSNTTNGTISITTTTSSALNTTLVRGISCLSTGGIIAGNQVGGYDMINAGSSPAPSTFQGIYVNSATAPTVVKSNIVGSLGTGAASNSIRVRAVSAALNNSVNGIILGSSVASAMLLDSNIIQNISINSTASSGSFTGIGNHAASGAAVTISNNSVKNIATGANASVTSGVYTGISATAPSVITNNIVDNIVLSSTGTAAQILGISVSGAFAFTVTGNTISNLSTASTRAADIESDLPSAYNITGILNASAASGQIVAGNILRDFSSTTIAATNTTVSGIGTEGGSGSIYNNRIATFTNTATGPSTLPGLGGIVASGGSFNVYNNVVKLDNSFYGNGVKVYGIIHNSGSNCNYYYNTVSLSGNATGIAARTASFIRTAGSTLLLRNNVFVNTRTGTGTHYAISNVVIPAFTNWSGTVSDHNDLYSSNAATIGEWGAGTSRTFAQWIVSSGGGAHSVSRPVSFLTSTSDLEPDNISNCALDATATSISSPVAITTDINNTVRNAITPDMGAYEFSYVPFTILAANNSPVCAGDNVTLSADPGSAYNPSFSWSNPVQSVISSGQNPSVAALAGWFTLIVSDANGCTATDSTLVALHQRPTATMTGIGSICYGSSVTLNITLTGTGTISGELNSGDHFSGTAPGVALVLSPVTSTSYVIASLSDANCVSIAADMPDTVTVLVSQAGLWSGALSSDWNTAGNWLCGSIPDTTDNIGIPGSLAHYPVINAGTIVLNDLNLQAGASITVNGSVLRIAGAVSGSGKIHATAGTIELSGTGAQTISGDVFSTKTVKNFTISNTAGVSLSDTLKISETLLANSGDLSSGGYLTLLSTTTATAVIDGSGAGQVLGSITMQRFLPSGFGYRDLSSPFKAATVAEFSDDIDLGASFSNIYRYDESLISAGWVNYSNAAGLLKPLEGYAVNCGSFSTAKTLDISGVANNGIVTSPTLYNHNNTYTLGFNLAGNPYPSPIDWDASGGWTRTNVDNAVYYFDAGSTDQYTGSYSSYANGISSNGVASNIIPSMQAFFIHVSNGSYPVSGSLSINNAARVNNHAPVFHKQTNADERPLARISAQFDDAPNADNTSVYFDRNAGLMYENWMDALKINNTDDRVPSLYSVSSDATRLSISGIPDSGDSTTAVPLGLITGREGWITFRAPALENIPAGMYVYLTDAETRSVTNMQSVAQYRLHLDKGTYDNRFFLLFSRTEKVVVPGVEDELHAYGSGNSVFVYLPNDRGSLRVVNTYGQLIKKEELSGKGLHEIKLDAASGVYIISLSTEKGIKAKKLFLGN